jgi:NAD(P)-dependent dehydrogenase (short-subunit alcohol dehydrogenase family)
MKLPRKKYLIVGGTDGIGRATAIHLASMGANVTIVGRSQEKANMAIQSMQSKSIEPNQLFEFKALDVTNIKNVHQFCLDVVGKLDGVVLCAGGLNYGPRRVTNEGIEMTFAQNYLSRVVFMKYLAPKLSGSRIIHCLGAGNGMGVNVEDLQLETSSVVPFFLRAANQCASLGDIIVKELAKRHSNQAQFFHYNPGIVNTNSAKNQGFPFLVHYAGSWVLPWIATKPETVAERLVHILESDEFDDKEKNGSLLGPTFAMLPYKVDPHIGERVWSLTEELINKLIQ